MTVPSVFISYSHEDEQQKDALLTQLGVLQSAGQVEVWSDDRIGPGADWEQEIQATMDKARVAVLLITANFLTSSFILNEEVPKLLRRREREGLTIFPVIAKACAWREVDWLARMNVRPKNGKPVWSDGGSHVDEDLAAITEEIAAIIRKSTFVDLTVTTPDGQRFAAEVRSDTLVDQILRDLLEQWPHEAHQVPRRYTLRPLAADNAPLDASQSLRETGLVDTVTLKLVAEPLAPDSPVGLTVENENGDRYTTAVRLDTRVERLADEFLRGRSGTGATVVELIGDDPLRPHPLNLVHSLYEEGIEDGARLRIYRARESIQELS